MKRDVKLILDEIEKFTNCPRPKKVFKNVINNSQFFLY